MNLNLIYKNIQFIQENLLNDFNLYYFDKFEIDYFNLIAHLPTRPINSSKLVVIQVINSVILIKHPNIDM